MDSNTNVKQRPSRSGQDNPMWGRSQSAETRRKQSEQQYRQWKDSQTHLTMDEFLSSQPLKEFISSIIREEITKLL